MGHEALDCKRYHARILMHSLLEPHCHSQDVGDLVSSQDVSYLVGASHHPIVGEIPT